MRSTAYIAITAALAVFMLTGEALAHGPRGPHGPKELANSVHMESQRIRRGVTPYGDFCPRCNSYGVGRRAVTKKAAFHALSAYFSARGFEIRNVRGMGRFLKVDIYKNDALVDRILFDRRTGRIRSIY
jgi:hypothetical protein